MRIFYLLFLLLALSVNASGKCELTEEYKQTRSEIAKIVYGEDNDYRRCQNAAYNAEYWLALSKCTENGDGKNIGGGCAHLVGIGKYIQFPDTNHCEIFKFDPTPDLAQSFLELAVKERGVEKCVK